MWSWLIACPFWTKSPRRTKGLNKSNLFAIGFRLQAAKKQETREKRIKEIIEKLAQGGSFDAHSRANPFSSGNYTHIPAGFKCTIAIPFKRDRTALQAGGGDQLGRFRFRQPLRSC